jgi:hypothetical protein
MYKVFKNFYKEIKKLTEAGLVKIKTKRESRMN